MASRAYIRTVSKEYRDGSRITATDAYAEGNSLEETAIAAAMAGEIGKGHAVSHGMVQAVKELKKYEIADETTRRAISNRLRAIEG